MALSEQQTEEVERIAELQVRRYFDHYLSEVFPSQVKGVVKAHDADREAHGGVERRVNQARWMLLGVSLGCGAGLGALLRQLFVLIHG